MDIKITRRLITKPTRRYLCLMEPRVGLEPTTFSLRMKCSTNWAIAAEIELRPEGGAVSHCKISNYFRTDQFFQEKTGIPARIIQSPDMTSIVSGDLYRIYGRR